ncbi:hypothetical protein GCM10012320_08450 [Sinomonas cellulolyticus]|uniref:Uncharacterized protein n=1 Tax=Sinomonas cellulolyticus TaxID=2801916 RepID=A0ABS1K3P6_9MICC|nr:MULTISPECIES: hypothetical protein [Sinomonas]MBL0706305.1 hypothetical protein [Sinomonas cellulolyticus]GHG43969.1 hypothetical protein GCM10012320_08450 [Sinomonas sp. KCTC 49339]
MEERFDRLEQQIGSVAGQLATLAQQVSKGFEGQQRQINELKDDVSGLKMALERKVDTDVFLEHLDGIREFLEDERLERTAGAAKLDRHEAWIEVASPKLGVSYPIDGPSLAA